MVPNLTNVSRSSLSLSEEKILIFSRCSLTFFFDGAYRSCGDGGADSSSVLEFC